MSQKQYRWHRQTIEETFRRIGGASSPCVPIGDFLDDWRRSKQEDRLELVEMGIGPAGSELESQRWAAFCAAMVEWLCWKDHLPFPSWTTREEFRLAKPWFLYPGDLLRAWQLASTPTPFRMRNIFSGDQVLDRV
jgi:hypothetical protein